MPELPGPAEISHELPCESSVAPGQSWDRKRCSLTVNPALLTNSETQGEDRSMDSMFYLSFNKQPKQR